MFILDTNVLINDPIAFQRFEENDVAIPMIVISELDGLKKRKDTTGRSAREVARQLDELSEKGDLQAGVPLPGGGLLRVLQEPSEVSFTHNKPINDDYIIQLAIETPNCTLITEDSHMRIRAKSLGVNTERYRNLVVECKPDEVEHAEFHATPEDIDDLYYHKNGEYDLEMNEYGLVKSHNNGSALIKGIGGGHAILVEQRNAMRLKPRNMEQSFLMDALFDERISMVAVTGVAGTGKTLLSVAAGLQQSTEKNDSRFTCVTVSRPVIPMGKDLGYLPGSMEEKMDPWIGPIYDNIEFLMNGSRESVYYYKDRGHLRVEALTYIRGRTLPHQFIIVDEAQNLTQHEIKTIVTRVGMGSKIVFTGDISQIDSPYLDKYNNGLSHIIERFRGQECFAHIHLQKGERSHLAELASKIL